MQVCICEYSALRGHRKVLNSLQLELQAAIRHLMLVLRVTSGSSTRAVWAPYHWGPYPTDHCAFKKYRISLFIRSNTSLFSCSFSIDFHVGWPRMWFYSPKQAGMWRVSKAEGERPDTALLLWVSRSSVPSSLCILGGETVPSLNTAANRRRP